MQQLGPLSSEAEKYAAARSLLRHPSVQLLQRRRRVPAEKCPKAASYLLKAYCQECHRANHSAMLLETVPVLSAGTS